MGEECTIGGGPEFGCCGDLICNRKEIVIDKKGGGYTSRNEEMAGGMGICEKPVDGDHDEEDEAKVQAKVYL